MQWKYKCEMDFFADCGITEPGKNHHFSTEDVDWKGMFQKRTKDWKKLRSMTLCSTDTTLAEVERGLIAKYVGWDGTGADSEAVGVSFLSCDFFFSFPSVCLESCFFSHIFFLQHPQKKKKKFVK